MPVASIPRMTLDRVRVRMRRIRSGMIGLARRDSSTKNADQQGHGRAPEAEGVGGQPPVLGGRRDGVDASISDTVTSTEPTTSTPVRMPRPTFSG